MKIRIYYEDTDAGGIVYHTNYIKYCERARSEHFFSKDRMPGENDKYGFVVRNINADFLGSARLGDIVEVQSRLLESKKSSLTLLQEIYMQESLIFKMSIVLVYVEEGKPRRIPEAMKQLFDDLQAE